MDWRPIRYKTCDNTMPTQYSLHMVCIVISSSSLAAVSVKCILNEKTWRYKHQYQFTQEFFHDFFYIYHVCDLLQLSWRKSIHLLKICFSRNQINLISGNRNSCRVKCFDENGSMDSQTTYEYNVMFLCYMLNREMINYSRLQVFCETFENVTQTSLIKVLLLKGVLI